MLLDVKIESEEGLTFFLNLWWLVAGVGPWSTRIRPQREPGMGRTRRSHLEINKLEVSMVQVGGAFIRSSSDKHSCIAVSCLWIRVWIHLPWWPVTVLQEPAGWRQCGTLSDMPGRVIKTIPGAMMSSGPCPGPTASGSVWVSLWLMLWTPCGSLGSKKVWKMYLRMFLEFYNIGGWKCPLKWRLLTFRVRRGQAVGCHGADVQQKRWC